MYAIIAIFAFLLFITYGISEHILVVSLHNIRVFLSRMCDGIKKIFIKKKSDTSEWEEYTSQSTTQQAEYRSFKEKEDNSIEQNLLAEIQQLKNVNDELNSKYNALDDKLKQTSYKLKSCEGTITKLKNENKEYQQRLNGLQPINKNNIADPFCNEHEQIMSIIDELIERLIIEFESLPDRQKKLCYPFFIDLVYDKRDEENNIVIRWYSLLKDVALVPKELSFDLNSRNEEISKLEYLQKYAFEKYYRMHIASAVLFAENIRLSVAAQERRKTIKEAIFKLIESLEQYGICVDYIPVNTIITDADFSKYEIESITNETEDENKILNVRKYAVNRSNVYAEQEKTILVVNI